MPIRGWTAADRILFQPVGATYDIQSLLFKGKLACVSEKADGYFIHSLVWRIGAFQCGIDDFAKIRRWRRSGYRYHGQAHSHKGRTSPFFYGQSYGGGGAIEAYIAAIPFAIFGASSIALKAVALCFWLVTIALCYRFCLQCFDYATAILSSIILIMATALIEWHLKMRGGYAAIPMFFMIILMCFRNLVDKASQRGWQLLAFGLVCGAAYYNLELILPFLFTLLLFSLYWRHIFWKWKPILLTVAGFIIGAGPLLLFNVTHGFINFRYVFSQGADHGGPNVFSNLCTLVIIYLPRFFVGRNVDQYISNAPITAYLEYAVYLMLFCCLRACLKTH